MKNKISVVINTYNAEKHLAEVLSHLKSFDEIVVCDMESTDSTCRIAEQHGCRVVTFPKGNITIVEPARNFAIQSAHNEWVLVLDADEIVTDDLARYLHEYVNRDDAAEALRIARINMLKLHLFSPKKQKILKGGILRYRGPKNSPTQH